MVGILLFLVEQSMHFCLGIASHAATRGGSSIENSIDALKGNDGIKKRYLAS